MRVSQFGRMRLLVVGVLCASALMVATTAAPLDIITSGPDTAGDVDIVGLEPHPAAENTYTHINQETGEIEIRLSPDNSNLLGDGVNSKAVIDSGPLFTVRNLLDEDSALGNETSIAIWIGHDSPVVDFYAIGDDADLGDGGTAPPSEPAVLEPGEELAIAMEINTSDAAEVQLLQTITVYVDVDSSEFSDEGETSEVLENPSQPDDTDTSTDDTDTSAENEPPTATTTPTPTEAPATDSQSGTQSSPTEDDEPIEESGLNGHLLLVLIAVMVGVTAATYGYRRYQ